MENKKTNYFKETLDKVLESIKIGQEEIFSIYDSLEKDCQSLQIELEQTSLNLEDITKEIKYLEEEEKISKKELVNVNKKHFNQELMEKTYRYASDIHIQVSLKRKEETNLVLKRNEIQIRIKRLKELVDKGDNYMNKMNSVIGFLNGDLENISKTVQSLEDRTSIGMKIIKNQEEERRRIVRDIHDGPAQNIASLVIKSEIAKRYLIKSDKESTEKELINMQKLLRVTLQDVRKIMYNISPTSLEEVGLISTVERFLYDVKNQNNIDVEFIVLNKEEISNHLLKLTIFRIIQESTNNALKHSKCTKLMVKMDINKNMVNFIVSDNGIGFNIENTSGKVKSLGIGFMKERAQLLQGDFKIDSTEGVGTKVICNFRYEEE